MIFNDLDKANEFNNFFAMQTDIDDSEAVIPELSLPDIEISETDVEDALSILNPSKTSGPDLINPDF